MEISISSKTKKHDPTYYITVTSSSGSNSRQLECPFTTWFTVDGYFVAKPFQQWLASSVDVIGDADKKNAVVQEDADDLLNDVNGTPSASGVDGKGKGTKRSKRKG